MAAVEHTTRRRHTLVAATLIIACGLAAYSNSFTDLFAGLDGKESIRDNPYIRRLWPISDALSLPMWRTPINVLETPAIAHRPTFSLSLALTNHFFGLEPKAHHAVNLALHLAAALTLFGIVRRTLRDLTSYAGDEGRITGLSLAASLIWLLHPLQTESVTYIVQRAEVLGGLFLFLTIYCAIRARASTRPLRWQATALLCCALGVGGKQTAALAPLLIALYDFVFPAHSGQRSWRPWFYAALLIPAILIPAAMGEKIQKEVYLETMLAYAVKQPWVILYYLRLIVWPDELHVYVNTALFDVRSPLQVIAPALVLVLMVLASAYGVIRRHWLGYIGAWFFITLAPTSTIIPIPDAIQEHRLYVPLAGVAVLAVIGGDLALRTLLARRLSPPAVRGVSLAALVLVLLGLGVRTYARNNDYHHEFAIVHPADLHGNYTILADHYLSRDDILAAEAEHAREVLRSPAADAREVVFSHFILALFHQRRGDLPQAVSEFETVLQLDPGFAYAHKEFGVTLRDTGDLPRARRHLERAIQLEPTMTHAYKELAVVFEATGDSAGAQKQLATALRIDPKFGEGLLELGVMELGRGREQQAEQLLRQALQARPDLADAHIRLADLMDAKGDADAAIEHLEAALRLRPDDAETLTRLGMIRRDRKEYDAAAQNFEDALRLRPDHADAYLELGILWRERGDLEKAIGNFDSALRHRPDFADVHNELGILWRERGELGKAAEEFRRAITLQPDHAHAHKELGLILLKEGKLEAAADHFRTALAADPDLDDARAGLARIKGE